MKDKSVLKYLVELESDSSSFRELMGSWTEEHLEKVSKVLNEILPKRRLPKLPVDLTQYQVLKQKMATILDNTWSVDLTVHSAQGIRLVKYIVAMQPDPKAEGWWYVRLLDWSVIRIKLDPSVGLGPDMPDLAPLPRLVYKTHMSRFFSIQRKLLNTEIKWKKLEKALDWNQLMLGRVITKHGEVVSLTHESYDAVEKAYYWLEDTRTRRKDYQWGKPIDPVASHQRGKKSKQALIEGEIPVDIGAITINDESLFPDTKQFKGAERQALEATIADTKGYLGGMVRHGEAELMYVGMPHSFAIGKSKGVYMKRMSHLFETCAMAPAVREQWAEVLWDVPFWLVKDKSKERWYVQSYDWRFGKQFSWCVMPIGFIEPARNTNGYYFCMYGADTLMGLNKQSLYIADYRVEITGSVAWRLDLDKDVIGQFLEFPVYNDWAQKINRDMAVPGAVRSEKAELSHVPIHTGCLPKVQKRQPKGRVTHTTRMVEYTTVVDPEKGKETFSYEVFTSMKRLYSLDEWLPKALLQMISQPDDWQPAPVRAKPSVRWRSRLDRPAKRYMKLRTGVYILLGQ